MFVAVSIRQDNDFGAVCYSVGDLDSYFFYSPLHAVPAFGNGVEAIDCEGLEFRVVFAFVQVEDFGQVLVGKNRVGNDDLFAGIWAGLKKIALGPQYRRC